MAATSMDTSGRVALGDGTSVPYPRPSSRAATNVGRANRRSDTLPEVAVRSALHRMGLRFRKDFPIRTDHRLIKVDVAFPRKRVAVLIDGCFWHCCPVHGSVPKSNTDYWVPKLQRNVERDRLSTEALEDAGWLVLRFWEHEEALAVAREISARLPEE